MKTSAVVSKNMARYALNTIGVNVDDIVPADVVAVVIELDDTTIRLFWT
jgi:hypothetical protein